MALSWSFVCIMLQSYSESITMDCFRGYSAGPKARLALWEIGIRVCVEGGSERGTEGGRDNLLFLSWAR